MFSVVMPIYNEEALLRYSLPSIYKLNPGEVILIFDKCNDGSLKVARSIVRYLGKEEITKFIELKVSGSYKKNLTEIRRVGYSESSYDLILNTDSDICLDPKIVNYLGVLDDTVKVIVFGFLDIPYNIHCFLRRVMSVVYKSYAGIYLFSKKAWLETDDSLKAKNIIDAEDSFLIKNIEKSYKIRFVNTKTIHLRPNECSLRHYEMGRNYCLVLEEKSWLKMFFYSLTTLRLMSFVGYLKARRNKNV